MSQAAFKAARDFLLAQRGDYATAYRDFRWPELDHFNWALDWFDAELAAGAHGARPALRIVGDGAAERSFAELSAASNRAANGLRDLGVKRGDRILLMLGNVVPLWEVMLAAMKLGAVVIPATTLLAGDDLKDRFTRGRARFVVANAADAPKFPGLEKAKEFGLDKRTDVTDLIEEQRPSLRPLKPSLALIRRAGEATSLMTEKLRVDQLGWNRPAVDAQKGAGRSGRTGVNRPRYHFFARPCVPENQNRHIGTGHQLNPFHHRPQSHVCPDYDLTQGLAVSQIASVRHADIGSRIAMFAKPIRQRESERPAPLEKLSVLARLSQSSSFDLKDHRAAHSESFAISVRDQRDRNRFREELGGKQREFARTSRAVLAKDFFRIQPFL